MNIWNQISDAVGQVVHNRPKSVATQAASAAAVPTSAAMRTYKAASPQQTRRDVAVEHAARDGYSSLDK